MGNERRQAYIATKVTKQWKEGQKREKNVTKQCMREKCYCKGRQVNPVWMDGMLQMEKTGGGGGKREGERADWDMGWG